MSEKLLKPRITCCSVCGIVGVNQVGSTECCGGISEALFIEEVEEMGIDSKYTRNTDYRTVEINPGNDRLN